MEYISIPNSKLAAPLRSGGGQGLSEGGEGDKGFQAFLPKGVSKSSFLGLISTGKSGLHVAPDNHRHLVEGAIDQMNDSQAVVSHLPGADIESSMLDIAMADGAMPDSADPDEVGHAIIDQSTTSSLWSEGAKPIDFNDPDIGTLPVLDAYVSVVGTVSADMSSLVVPSIEDGKVMLKGVQVSVQSSLPDQMNVVQNTLNQNKVAMASSAASNLREAGAPLLVSSQAQLGNQVSGQQVHGADDVVDEVVTGVTKQKRQTNSNPSLPSLVQPSTKRQFYGVAQVQKESADAFIYSNAGAKDVAEVVLSSPSQSVQVSDKASVITSRMVTSQVAEIVGRTIARPGGSIQIQLTPEELGRVDVTLQKRGGVYLARVVVEKIETLEIIRSDIRNLERSLSVAGVHVEAGSISLEMSSGSGVEDDKQQENDFKDLMQTKTVIISETENTVRRLSEGRGHFLNISV